MLWIRRSGLAVVAACLLTNASMARATSVLAPSFDELIAKAEIIFVGDVVDRRTVWEESRDGRRIVTLVTFDVARVLKGQVGLRTQLRFLGGTIGDRTLEVSGMPEFRVGDRDVLFVLPGRNAASPLVGFWHGRFRVVRDEATGEQRLRTHDGHPVIAGLDIAKPLEGATRLGAAAQRRPLTLEDFETLVKQRLESGQVR
jgi:hypothetical protein